MPVDGFSLLPVLNASISLRTPIRGNDGELWIADDVLRIGDYKLITGMGAAAPNCMLGIGGNPVSMPTGPNDLSNRCGASHCTGKEAPGSQDAMICTGCRCPSYSGVYSAPTCTPCLFNVRTDPGERVNLADAAPSEHATRLATMTSRLLELQKTRYDPVYPEDNFTAACEVMRENGGFFSPWAVYAPAPAPPPPTVDCTFIAQMDQFPAAWQPGSRDGVPSTSPEACCKQCKKDATCFVGVFSGGYCFFKPINATRRPRAGCISCFPKGQGNL